MKGAISLDSVIASRRFKIHQLSGDLDERFALRLDGKYRLIVEVNEPIPRKPDQGIDLEKVNVIQINEIKDYH